MPSRNGQSAEPVSANRHETGREGASPYRSLDVWFVATTLIVQMGVDNQQNERFTRMSDKNDPKDTEGHKHLPSATDDDTEGHKHLPSATDDDTEGHRHTPD
jgi:hypothetical protein